MAGQIKGVGSLLVAGGSVPASLWRGGSHQTPANKPPTTCASTTPRNAQHMQVTTHPPT